MDRPGRLEGLGCAIVGATGGIGLAAARRFLDEGARVVAAGRTVDEAVEAFGRLGPAAVRAVSLGVEVGDEDSVERFVDAAVAALGGRLDVLFHVAGISGRRYGDGPLHECTTEGWDAVVSINARGAFLTNRSAVRRMLEQPIDASGLRGTVLNLGSVLAGSPSPGHFGTVAYAASKGALESLTRAAAARYAPDRIRFNLIAPGLIDTPIAARAVGDPSIRRYLEGKQPLSAGPGSPGDVAEAAVFLCEPASRFVTGVVLEVAGGWSLSEGSS